MIELKQSIPQRLNSIRTIATLSLVISFFLSYNLWWGENLFPKVPFNNNTDIPQIAEAWLAVVSIASLLISIVARKHRLFLMLSLGINCVLALDDTMRLQPWFLLYNSILIITLIFNGRVDDPGHFTYLFIILQLIIGSVYLFNGLYQAINPNFINSDYFDAIQPLMGISTERQFLFFMKAGKLIPYLSVLSGLLILAPQTRFIAIPVILFFHLIMFILLVPSTAYDIKSAWFMHLSSAAFVVLMFSGQTKQRYFSPSILFQKPVFYLSLIAFGIAPLIKLGGWNSSIPALYFSDSQTRGSELTIERANYESLPLYVRHFCKEEKDLIKIDLKNWCRHELNSDLTVSPSFPGGMITDTHKRTNADVKETQDELSSL